MNTFAHSAEAFISKVPEEKKMASNTMKMLLLKMMFSSLLEAYDLEKLPFKTGNTKPVYFTSPMRTDT